MPLYIFNVLLNVRDKNPLYGNLFLYALIVLLESIDLILAHYAGIMCPPIMLEIMLAYLTEAYLPAI